MEPRDAFEIGETVAEKMEDCGFCRGDPRRCPGRIWRGDRSLFRSPLVLNEPLMGDLASWHHRVRRSLSRRRRRWRVDLATQDRPLSFEACLAPDASHRPCGCLGSCYGSDHPSRSMTTRLVCDARTNVYQA